MVIYSEGHRMDSQHVHCLCHIGCGGIRRRIITNISRYEQSSTISVVLFVLEKEERTIYLGLKARRRTLNMFGAKVA